MLLVELKVRLADVQPIKISIQTTWSSLSAINEDIQLYYSSVLCADKVFLEWTILGVWVGVGSGLGTAPLSRKSFYIEMSFMRPTILNSLKGFFHYYSWLSLVVKRLFYEQKHLELPSDYRIVIFLVFAFQELWSNQLPKLMIRGGT